MPHKMDFHQADVPKPSDVKGSFFPAPDQKKQASGAGKHEQLPGGEQRSSWRGIDQTKHLPDEPKGKEGDAKAGPGASGGVKRCGDRGSGAHM